MKKTIITVLLALFAGILHSGEKDIVSANTDFAFKLYKNLKEGKGNILFSPYSISTAFAMTYAGARGETEKQMADALCFKVPQKEVSAEFAKIQKDINAYSEEKKCRILVANSIWPDRNYKFLDEFIRVMKDDYGTELKQVDYRHECAKARLEINSWVEKKTNEKIKDIIPDGVLNDFTRLVLVNAIYFKGDWKSQFDDMVTTDAPFYSSPAKSSQVKTMFQKEKFKYFEDKQVQVLQMAYSKENLSMIIVLPKEKEGLPELEKEMDPAKFADICSKLAKHEVKLFLPRMKIKAPTISLKQAMTALGMEYAFNNRADFSGMDGTQDLYIQDALHQAFMEVNEEGTEAAAATAVVVGLKCEAFPQKEIIFRADHPFMFLICDSISSSILFMGRISEL